MSRRKVVACLYLDNQAEAQYPLEHVIRSVGFADEWVFAASDLENEAYLAPFGPTIITGRKIRESEGISRMMNDVRGLAFALTGADVVVFVQADTLSTPEVNGFVRDFAEVMDLSIARWLHAVDSQLYMDFQSGWGFSIVGREWPGRFHADGLSEQAQFLTRESSPSCLHVGYLSTALARRHRRLAARLWSMHDHVGLIDAMDDDEFVKFHLDHVWKHAPVPYTTPRPIEEVDERYSAVIDEMGLREDQAFVHDVLARWKAERGL